jgi:hypothetical protein
MSAWQANEMYYAHLTNLNNVSVYYQSVLENLVSSPIFLECVFILMKVLHHFSTNL